MKLEDYGKHFAYKAKLDNGNIVYVIGKTLNQVSKKLEKVCTEKVVSIDFLGDALP